MDPIGGVLGGTVKHNPLCEEKAVKTMPNLVEHPSLVATRYVRDHVRGDPMGHFVGLAIAAHVDEHGQADIGVRAIANDTGLHTATVVRALSRLEAAGHLRVHRRGRGRGSSYRYPQVRAQDAQVRAEDAQPVRAQDAHPGGRGVRAQDAQVRGSDAHSVPGGTNTNQPCSPRSGENKEITTTTSALLPHAVAALALLEPYVRAEARARPPRTTVGAVEVGIRRRIERDFLDFQDQCSTPAELVSRITGVDEADDVEKVAALLAAAMSRPAPAVVEVRPHFVDEEGPVLAPGDWRASRAFASGLAEVRPL